MKNRPVFSLVRHARKELSRTLLPRRSQIFRGAYTCPAIALCIAFTGCYTEIRHASGTPWVKTYGNSANFTAQSGTDTFTVISLNHSTPTRAALLGANKIAGMIGSAAVAIAVPGAGATSMVTKAVISSTPHLTSPAAAPADKSPASIWPTSP